MTEAHRFHFKEKSSQYHNRWLRPSLRLRPASVQVVSSERAPEKKEEDKEEKIRGRRKQSENLLHVPIPIFVRQTCNFHGRLHLGSAWGQS